MGKRGPKPGSGGRPRKAISEKIVEGNPGRRPLMLLKNIPELECAEMPPPREYLSDEQKNGSAFPAKEIYTTVWNWLQERKCAQHVSAELVEHYAVSAARLIQCEQAISNYGFIAKNAQGGAIVSPYVTAAHDYMKQANRLWDMIGDWTGGTDVDAGATNRKLGSDMADSVTGGGLHGKDLSKADVSVNIYAFLKAQETGETVQLSCAIGDETVDGKPYAEIVETAKKYIDSVGGFEKFAMWGLV